MTPGCAPTASRAVAAGRALIAGRAVAAGPGDPERELCVLTGDLLLGVGLIGAEAVRHLHSHAADGRGSYVYHGTLDPVVNALVSDAGVSFYQSFGANVEYHNWDPAGHSWVTPYGPVACSLTSPPCMNNCGDDPEGRCWRTGWAR